VSTDDERGSADVRANCRCERRRDVPSKGTTANGASGSDAKDARQLGVVRPCTNIGKRERQLWSLGARLAQPARLPLEMPPTCEVHDVPDERRMKRLYARLGC
jgi:hypothetical protein